jgi:hypothetical protein
MQSKPPEKGFGLDHGNESSISSFSDDDEISDASLGNNYSTISIINDSAVPGNDVDELHPTGIEADGEMDLGLEASGGGSHHDSGEIIEGEGGADYLCPSDNTRLIPKSRSIAHLCIKDGSPFIRCSTSKSLARWPESSKSLQRFFG